MCRTVLAALALLAASAFALGRSGAPGDIHPLRQVGHSPDHDQVQLEAERAPSPASAFLERMSQAERKNACISVEFSSCDAELIALGHDVERLWNDGEFDDALAQLGDLEAHVGDGHVAVGTSWRKPLPTLETTLWNSDVRIGDRDHLLDLSFDTHISSGNLFVAFRHGGSESQKMSVCMSSDGGLTWSETFDWNGADTLTTLDAAVLASHLYIAYCYPGNPQEVRLRRLNCTDGLSDTFNNGSSWVTACTLAVGDTASEVSLVSTQHSNNIRLYMTTLVSDGSMRFSWDDTNAVSWTEIPTGITSGASRALDATENEGHDTTFLYFSYYDTNDTLRIYGITGGGGVTRRYSRYTGNGEVTTISAYGDTCICAFDDEVVTPYRITYVINYGDTATWRWGTLSDTTITAESPGVAARGGGGLAVVFRHYTPTRELRLRQRGYPIGVWSDPVSIADSNHTGIDRESNTWARTCTESSICHSPTRSSAGPTSTGATGQPAWPNTAG